MFGQRVEELHGQCVASAAFTAPHVYKNNINRQQYTFILSVCKNESPYRLLLKSYNYVQTCNTRKAILLNMNAGDLRHVD